MIKRYTSSFIFAESSIMSVNMKKKISFLGALASVAMLSAPAANAYLIFWRGSQ